MLTDKEAGHLRDWANDEGQRDKVRITLGGDWRWAACLVLLYHDENARLRAEVERLRDEADRLQGEWDECRRQLAEARKTHVADLKEAMAGFKRLTREGGEGS